MRRSTNIDKDCAEKLATLVLWDTGGYMMSIITPT